MSGAKEIRTKIASIGNTQKITRAMEMVAASKMRKAQDRMQKTRPYAEKMFSVISHLAYGQSEYKHPFLVPREVKNVGVIVISTDRGLCGGLNNNLFRACLNQFKQWQDADQGIRLALLGRKAENFFKRLNYPIKGIETALGDMPGIEHLIGIVTIMLDEFYQGNIDALYVAYNRFVNTMTQTPLIEQFLPLKKADDDTYHHRWDYIYEPDAKELLDGLLKSFIESETYQAVVENIACEQASRMVAMKSASDNAGELIKEFQLAYNKARQASITQEIAEIVGGAAAV